MDWDFSLILKKCCTFNEFDFYQLGPLYGTEHLLSTIEVMELDGYYKEHTDAMKRQDETEFKKLFLKVPESLKDFVKKVKNAALDKHK